MAVSIHTRHYWRVKRLLGCISNIGDAVSIHTRHYWRVKQSVRVLTRYSARFQSTPAITGG